jgi:hypothetical protein
MDGKKKEPDPARRMGVNLTKIARFFLTVPELRLQPIFSGGFFFPLKR